MQRLRYFSEVITLELDEAKCNHCGMCVRVCPHQVFEIIDKKVRIIGRDFCIECGACRMNCPQGAISLDAGNGCGCAAGIIEGAFKGKDVSCSESSKSVCCN